jgi:hypothetical protein
MGERPLAAAATSPGAAALEVACGQLGVAETGGENRGVPYERYVRFFGAGLPPSPWCAFFVSWCFVQAGFEVPWANPGYVPSVEEWAQAHGRLVEEPRRGDLFGLGGDHMGFVLAPGGGASFTTCEGNCRNRVLSRRLARDEPGIWFARW